MKNTTLLKYLLNKGIINEREYQHILEEYNAPDKYTEFFSNFEDVTERMNKEEKIQFVDRLKDFGNTPVEHFTESYAKYIVSKMWHKDTAGRKYIGEKYDILKAKEVYERYKNILGSIVTYSDIYVAINSVYHSCYGLLLKWFNSDCDDKIIELALTFWFRDDCYGLSKLWTMFKDK